jgi:hypothetical protein
MWPDTVHISEIQSFLLHDGVPVERAMRITSELGPLPPGDSYRIQREQGDIYLHRTVVPGYFQVSAAA